ncbi:MAG: hypothetical protein KGR16_05215 [Verrucomicrobia bacterium]|nr:hypothetical protein [Verrucomicrobiota bacterium]MDE3047144.1 hypothetical protein [Verrucomicrobiota bacterium]
MISSDPWCAGGKKGISNPDYRPLDDWSAIELIVDQVLREPPNQSSI